MEYGLIGERLGHSYSRQIHSRLADYKYELKPLSKEEFPVFMEKKEFKAVNVTIPYKRDVIPYLSYIDPLAAQIGAVNTIVNRNGQLAGYNTDYFGFLYLLSRHNIQTAGKKVLVLGNGGVAKPVFTALKELDAACIIPVKYKEEPETITYEQAAALHSDADIIINASPVGMYPNIDVSPIELAPYTKLEAAVDLIANPLETLFLKEARSLGVNTAGGLDMLVAQAKYAVEFFLETKISNDVIPPICEEIAKMMQ